MTSCARWLWVMLLVGILAACGGGGGDSAPTATALTQIAERIDVGPQSALLTQAGERRQLTATVHDTSGQTMQATLAWSSSDALAVSVDANGQLRAEVAAGSAWITARSGTVTSAPVLVTIAQPVAGARLLADSQIVAGPTPVDTNAEPAAGNPYEVLVRGIPTLAVGSLVIASESANVAGRVLSVQPEGSDQRVRLVTVPPTQLFSAFAFRDTVDLASAVFDVPADITARYNVVQNGATYVFSPRPGVTSERKRPAAATGTSALPPVPPFGQCEMSPDFGSGLPLPLALSAPPTFEVTVDGSLQRDATSAGTRMTLTGQPKFKLSSAIEIRAAFEAKIGCKATLLTRKLRVPGWAGLFFGGDVEFGVGFEIGGKVTIASAKLGAEVRLDTALSAVLDCPATSANCSLTGSATATSAFEPQFTAPALAQAQYEPALNLFGFVSLEAGNADIEQLQFKAIELKAGAELAAALTAEALQIVNLDADTGRSKYALAFKGEVGPGIKLGEFLSSLGLSEVVPLKLGLSVDLGGSPKAASVVADRARYLPGERANVVVKLDAASTRFPLGLLYNVERVELRRNSGLFGTEVLAQQNANEGQTEFTLAFDSPGLIDVGEIFAFVFTKALPFMPVSFELAAAKCMGNCGLEVSPASVTLNPGASQQFTATFAGAPTTAVIWSASAGSIDASGRYTAPAATGQYTVTATSNDDASNRASANVQVASDGGATHISSRGLVSATPFNVGPTNCDGNESKESPVFAKSWTETVACSGSQGDHSAAGSATMSFSETYSGSQLVAVSASSTGTATSGGAGGVIAVGQYRLRFRVVTPTTLRIDASVSGTNSAISLTSQTAFIISGVSSANQSLPLAAGTYDFAIDAGANVSNGGSANAAFTVTLGFGQ